MLDGLKPPVTVRSCAVRTVLESLDDKDQKIFITAINDVSLWKAETLSNSLRERGVSLSGKSITYHRKGGCTCLKN